MQEVRDGLEAFLRGETDIDGLLSSIDQALERDAKRVPEFLGEVRALYQAGRLPAQLLSVVEQQVAMASRRRTGSPPAPNLLSSGAGVADRVSASPGSILPARGKPESASGMTPAQIPAGGRRGDQSAPDGSAEFPLGHPSASPVSPSLVSGSSSGWVPREPQPGEPRVGQVLKDRFELVEVLGRGGMSVVFKARDRRKAEASDRNPYVALKLLNEDYKHHPEALKTLQREARKAQGLKHRNVINIFDFDKDEDDNYFVAMELLTGTTLERVIRQHRHAGGMETREAYRLIEQMARALEAGHTHSPPIVHSDFKPGNVFLTEAGEIKVFDFGIARAARTAAADGGETTRFDAGVLGALTPAYASPEMLAGMEPDPRDDIYGLAVVAYELLSGHRPFGRMKTAVDAVASGLRPERITGLSARQWKGLERALAFERERRTPTVERFLDDLRHRRSRVPAYLAAGTAAAAAIAWFSIGQPLLKAQRERAIVQEAAVVEQARLPDLVESAADLSPAARATVHQRIAERLLRPLVDGDAAEAAFTVDMVRGFPRTIQEAVYEGMEEPLVARLLDADPEVAAAAAALTAKLPSAAADAVFAAAGARLIAGFRSADDAGIAALLEMTQLLPQEPRRQVLARAKIPIVEHFRDTARQRFSPRSGRYDFTGAREALELGLVLYPDSKTVEEALMGLDADRAEAVSRLRALLLRELKAGRVLADGPQGGLPGIVRGLRQLDADVEPDVRREMVAAYLDRSDEAMRRGDPAAALTYAVTGSRLFPEDSSLRGAQAGVAAALLGERGKDHLAAIRNRVRRLQEGASAEALETFAGELRRLAELRPDDPLVAEGMRLLGEWLDTRLAGLAADRSWQAAAVLFEESSDLFPPEMLTDRQRRFDQARAEFERGVAGLMWRISEFSQAGRADEAYAILSRLAKLDPGEGTLAQARGKIAQSYLTLAREARAAGRWDEARRTAKKGLARIPDASAADSFHAELAEIDRAEGEANSGLSRSEGEELQEERLKEIAALRKDFETKLGTMEATEADAREALDLLGWLAAVNPTDSLIGSGRERIAARFVEKAEALAADGRWEDAIGAIREGRSAIPESSLLAQAGSRIEEGRLDGESLPGSSQPHPLFVGAEPTPGDGDKAPVEGESALAYWNLIKDTENIAAVRAFLRRFQDPVLAALAEQRLEELQASGTGVGVTPEDAAGSSTLGPAPVPANPGSPPPVPVGDDGEAADALARAAEIPPHLIQQALKDLGFHTGAIDGKIGTGTREAIRSFQKARGLTRTGELTHGQVVSLVRTAAEAGRAESQNTLGMMAAEGIGIPKDLEVAHHWFRTAAAQGNAHAAYNLGILFRDGRGVARSDSQARHYFELALADGLPRAREALEALDH